MPFPGRKTHIVEFEVADPDIAGTEAVRADADRARR